MNDNKDNVKINKSSAFIYFDIDEEIGDIIEKITKNKNEEVFLMIPQKAGIFQSGVNLKILKRSALELGKKITIVTKDGNGQNLCRQLEIKCVAEMNKNAKKKKTAREEKEENDSPLNIFPLKATSNELKEDNPKRVSLKKISISEILNRQRMVEERKSEKKGGEFFNQIRAIKESQAEKGKTEIEIKPSRRTVFTLIGISLIILLIIGYIALPGATIYLTPKSSVLHSSINIILADAEKNISLLRSKEKNIVPSYTISKTIVYKGSYNSTGKVFKGTNARGTITIYNNSLHEWPLIKGTRFQSPEGYIYRIKQDISVPRGNSNEPGKIDAEVEADPLDDLKRIVGEKGNIGPSDFFLPGIRESSRSQIYAKNQTAFSGGSTKVINKVLPEDLDAAKVFLAEKIKETAKIELNKEVESYNAMRNGDFALLDNTIIWGDLSTNFPKDLVDKEISTFEIEGSIPIKASIYDNTALLTILKETLKKASSPDKEISKIDEKSLGFKLVEMEKDLSTIKLTASMAAIEFYKISPESDEGFKLIKKIKERTAGMSIAEATSLIQNLPEVHKVEIKSWPIWTPYMPTMAENIKVELVY